MTKVIFPPKLKAVINEKVANAVFNHPHTEAWHKEVASKIQAGHSFDHATNDYHRLTICGQGQADFRTGNFGLTTDDIALLYCFYFFQMHFTSSVAVYYKYQDDLVQAFQSSSEIHFVDVGCGPYTSGFAFLYFTQVKGIREKLADRIDKVLLSFYGVDNATSMTDLGDNLLTAYQNTLPDTEFKYRSISKSIDFATLATKIGNAAARTIIINCCYFFASNSLDISQFTASIQALMDNNREARILFFYQNAPTGATKVSGKFSSFKQAIKDLSANGTNVEELAFSYDDEFKAAKRTTLNLRVRQQLLKNY